MSVLSEKEALRRSRTPNIASIRNLNCWGCSLSDVSVLKTAHQLEVLNLSCNQLASLQDLAHCSCLRELFLRKNQISEFSQLQPLVQVKKLRTLWLSGNPVAQQSNYRSTVIQMLPQIVSLDNSAVTEEERRKTTAHQQEGSVLSAVLCLLPVLSQQELRTVHNTAGQMLSQQ